MLRASNGLQEEVFVQSQKCKGYSDEVVSVYVKFPTFCGKWHSTCVVFPEKEKEGVSYNLVVFHLIFNNQCTLLTKHKEVTRT